MLILTRRVGETLMVGDDITVTVLGVKGNQVRIGVNAPKEVAVHREEIYQRIQSEKGESFRREEAWIRIEDIIACSAAMYDAPLSPETLEAIRGASELYDLPSYTDIAMIQKAGTGDDQ